MEEGADEKMVVDSMSEELMIGAMGGDEKDNNSDSDSSSDDDVMAYLVPE